MIACDAYDAGECAVMRERAVAGASDIIPPCPVHGSWSDAYAAALAVETFGPDAIALAILDAESRGIAVSPALRMAVRSAGTREG